MPGQARHDETEGERHSFFRHESWLRAFHAAEDFFDLTLIRRQALP